MFSLRCTAGEPCPPFAPQTAKLVLSPASCLRDYVFNRRLPRGDNKPEGLIFEEEAVGLVTVY